MTKFPRILTVLSTALIGALSILSACSNESTKEVPFLADAGRDRFVKTGQVVWLNGTGSNFHLEKEDDNALTFKWRYISRPAGSKAPLSGTFAVFDSFVPDIAGEYVFEVRARTRRGVISRDQVTITATTQEQDSPPNAHGGPYQFAQVGDLIILDARQSHDPDGDILSSTTWTMEPAPGSLAELYDSDGISTYFIADVPGTYHLSLGVNSQRNGTGDIQTDHDDIFVLVSDSGATPMPVADAGYGFDQYVKTGSQANLDGSLSYDAQDNELSYQWRILTRPRFSNAILDNTNSDSPGFVADVDGTYVVQLEVKNTEHSSNEYNNRDEQEYRDRTVIVADSGNSAPMARLSFDQTILLGGEVVIDGTDSSDADKNELIYNWSFVKVAGSPLTPPDLTYSVDGDKALFTPDTAGVYAIRLVVNDGFTNSLPAISLVYVWDENQPPPQAGGNTPPIANAGPDQSYTSPREILLDGSGSIDLDGDSISYLWSFSQFPRHDAPALSDAKAEQPTFTASRSGTYWVQLVVNDGTVDSIPDHVKITISNMASGP